MKPSILSVLTVGLIALSSVSISFGQDMAKVVFDNEHVRATEHSLRASENEALQAHAPYFLFWLSASVVELSLDHSKSEAKTYNFEDVQWFDESARAIATKGSTVTKFLIVEIKERATGETTSPVPDEGTKISAEQSGKSYQGHNKAGSEEPHAFPSGFGVSICF